MFNYVENKLGKFILTILVTLNLIGVSYCLIITPANSVASVNITELYASFVKETAEQNLSTSDKKEKVSQFGRALEKILNEVSHKRNLVFLPSEAVITGAPDVTNEIKDKLKRVMNQ